MRPSTLEEAISEYSYVRRRFSTSQNHLLVGLWTFFEKAAAGLTSLYRGNLDGCSDNQCLIEALHRIDSFHRASDEILQCAMKQGVALGYHCQRLLLRDRFLGNDLEAQLRACDIFSSVLQDYDGGQYKSLHHKRRRSCRRTCHCRARRPPIKRCRLHRVVHCSRKLDCLEAGKESSNFENLLKKPEKNGFMHDAAFDFSKASLELPKEWPLSMVEFSSVPASQALGFLTNYALKARHRRSRSYRPLPCNNTSPVLMPSAAVTDLAEAGFIPTRASDTCVSSNAFEHQLFGSPPSLSRKRLAEQGAYMFDTDPAFLDAVHLSSLIDPLSKCALNNLPSAAPSPKRQRLSPQAQSQDLPTSSKHPLA
uniref:Uncharacterized protein n=1 Tax=Schistocephalus solidus TaxID=70667 RepID=A0A0X3P503_SCHSO